MFLEFLNSLPKVRSTNIFRNLSGVGLSLMMKCLMKTVITSLLPQLSYLKNPVMK